MPLKRWFTVQEVARAYGVSDFIARALLRTGQIPGGTMLPGGRWVCDVDAFGEWAAARRNRPVVDEDPSVVYFIQQESAPDAPVKIGVSTWSGLDRRLRSLQTGHPHALVVLAVMRGDAKDEKRLHESFAHARLSGEWFKPTEGLLAIIEGLR